MTINEMCSTAHKNAVEKGFYENRKINIGEKLMLIVSELGEALEADRNGKYTSTNLCGETIKQFCKDKLKFEHLAKDTFEDELADAVIRIGDLAAALDIDLESHVIAKMKYNSFREKRHGKAY
jgi:NTP pyrophosphatase (non-canonical NTP hydrolase)